MRKKIRKLSMFLASVMILSMLIINVFAAPIFPFSDVKSDAWYYKDVKNAYEKKLINGKTDTTYGPNDNMTYAEAVKLAACMHQLKKEGSVKLKNATPWYQSYVDYAKKHNLISADLSWNEKVTRAGYMEIFANVLTDAESKKNNVPDGSIPDVPVTHQNAMSIYKLYRAGIVTGVDAKHHCDPDASIRRSEVAAILTRMTDKAKRVAFSMSSTTTASSGGSSSEDSSSGGSGSSGGGFSGSGMSIVTPPLTPGGSSLATITLGKLAIKTHPQASTDVYNYGSAKLVVEVQGGSEPYAYEWQAMKNDGTFETITVENYNSDGVFSGTDQSTLNLAVDSGSGSARDYTLRCVIKDSKGEEVISKQAKINYKKFMVTKNPEDITIRGKNSVKMEVEVTGGDGNYQYQWEIDLLGPGDDWGLIEEELPAGVVGGSKTPKLTLNVKPDDDAVNRHIRCVIKDGVGNQVESDSALIFVDFGPIPVPEDPIPIPLPGPDLD